MELILQLYFIPHSALQVYYKGIFNEEGGLQPLLLLRTINSLCNMYFDLQSLELLSGKAFNSMSDILHFDVRNVSYRLSVVSYQLHYFGSPA